MKRFLPQPEEECFSYQASSNAGEKQGKGFKPEEIEGGSDNRGKACNHGIHDFRDRIFILEVRGRLKDESIIGH